MKTSTALGLLFTLGLAAVSTGCASSSSSSATGGPGGAGGGGGAGVAGGSGGSRPSPGLPGGSCLPDGTCISGLTCAGSRCSEAPASTPGESGAVCLPDLACSSGLACNGGVCTAGPPGTLSTRVGFISAYVATEEHRIEINAAFGAASGVPVPCEVISVALGCSYSACVTTPTLGQEQPAVVGPFVSAGSMTVSASPWLPFTSTPTINHAYNSVNLHYDDSEPSLSVLLAGDVFPPFFVSLPILGSLQWLGESGGPKTIPMGTGVELKWQYSAPGNVVARLVSQAETGTKVVRCEFPGASGNGTIPPDALAFVGPGPSRLTLLAIAGKTIGVPGGMVIAQAMSNEWQFAGVLIQ